MAYFSLYFQHVHFLAYVNNQVIVNNTEVPELDIHYKSYEQSKCTELLRYYTTGMALKLFWIPFKLGQIKENCTY